MREYCSLITSSPQLLQRWRPPRWPRCWAAASSPRAPSCRRTPPPTGSACGRLPRSALPRSPAVISASMFSAGVGGSSSPLRFRPPGPPATGRTPAAPRQRPRQPAPAARSSGTSGASQRAARAPVEHLRHGVGGDQHGQPRPRPAACQNMRGQCHGRPSANTRAEQDRPATAAGVLDQRKRRRALLGARARCASSSVSLK